MQFLGASHVVEIVNQVGLDRVFNELVTRLDRDFRRWDEYDKCSRVASYSAEGVIELMPASDQQWYGFKYVNGHPKNFDRGLQTVTAFGALAAMDTGYPIFLAELTIGTALRTAAMSVLAAKYLARKHSSSMALIGLGAQAEFQASAFHSELGIGRLKVFDIDPRSVEKFLQNLAASDLCIEICNTVEEAVAGVDIVTTVTADKRRATILSDNMIGAGMHLNAVGGDCPGKTELQKELLLRSDIFVEYLPQTRIEGEIQQLPATALAIELWEVIVGANPGRTSERQITLFDSVGFAVEDLSLLCLLRDLAIETGFYAEIDLIAEPSNPRDLFGLLNRTSIFPATQSKTV